MSKRTKIAVFFGVVAAIVSAVVLIVVFWDRLLEKCPCCKKQWDEEFLPEEEPAEAEIVTYTEEETESFADLATEEE